MSIVLVGMSGGVRTNESRLYFDDDGKYYDMVTETDIPEPLPPIWIQKLTTYTCPAMTGKD